MQIFQYSSVVNGRSYRVFLSPKSHAVVETFTEKEIISMRKYKIGDIAAYDKLIFSTLSGPIVSIGKNSIGIKTNKDKIKKLTPEEFSWRNWNFTPPNPPATAPTTTTP